MGIAGSREGIETFRDEDDKPKRKRWTKSEDLALLHGWKKYGQSYGCWAQILKDRELGAVLAEKSNIQLKVRILIAYVAAALTHA